MYKSARLLTMALAFHGAAHAAAPVFTIQPCPATAAQAAVPITCGTVAVPEDRAISTSRLINIAVIIAHSQAVPHQPDPVVLEAGGPEGAIDGDIAALSQPGAAAVLGNRDLIAFDYRGIGYSTPNLTCPTNAQGQPNPANCVASLIQGGAALGGYTTRNVAADLHDIRLALHLPALNLWGTSYGSRIAMTLARDFPADVRSMVLDGPDPLQSRENAALLVARSNAILGLLSACGADHACNHAFPHLYERYQAAVARLNAHPLTVDGVAQTGDQLVFDLWAAQTNYAALPLLPALMDQVARGTLTTLSSLGAATADNNATAFAAQALMACNASSYGPDRAGVIAILGSNAIVGAMGRAQDLGFLAQCHPWPFKPLTAKELEPLRSAVPTLVFSGQYDPTLPLAEAQATVKTLSHARIIQFPGYAHVALGNGPCPVLIAQQLFDTLQPDQIVASCTRTLPQPAWVTALPAP